MWRRRERQTKRRGRSRSRNVIEEGKRGIKGIRWIEDGLGSICDVFASLVGRLMAVEGTGE